MFPRRGPPVAAIEGPCRCQCEEFERGGLAGAIPEALCGEAPEGQPMTRGENLEVVCVEAPQGQPMNHRPKNQHVSRPTGNRRENRRERR